MTDDTDISYEAAARETPVLTSSGTKIGSLEHVLEVPEVDVFDGIAIAEDCGLRFIEAGLVQEITRSHFRCNLNDAQASRLPSPGGPPVYRVDALADSGIAYIASWVISSGARTGCDEVPPRSNGWPVRIRGRYRPGIEESIAAWVARVRPKPALPLPPEQLET